jgi:hypothetical protein
MASYEVSRHVALARADVSIEHSASIIRATRIGELGKTFVFIFLLCIRRLLVTTNIVCSSQILVTLMMGGDKFLRNVGSYNSHTA